MLKRIRTQDLTLGMFLHEFCGSWMDYPFWRSKFLLKDAKDLTRILNTSINEVWIDTSRGLDVASSAAVVTREQADAEIDTAFSQLADLPELDAEPQAFALPPVRQQQQHRPSYPPSSMEEELKKAAHICRESKGAMVAMFNEARMGRALKVPDLQNLVENISASMTRHPDALISLVRLKKADEYTYMHSVAVCALMLALGRKIKLNAAQLSAAGMAGLLHDLGKAGIPLSVLNKPGKLTDEEFNLVRQHPVEGHRMLVQSGMRDPAVLDACLHHHEKINGQGYPGRLQGGAISLLARMTAICDVYDAITSDRPYKRGWDPSVSLRNMAEWCSSHFDEGLFHSFVKSIGVYPVGSMVRLQSKRIGVVVEQSPGALLLPRISTFYCLESNQHVPQELVDLSRPGCTDKIIARENPEHWRLPQAKTMHAGMAPLH